MNRQSCPACQRHRLNGFVSRPAAATRSSLRLLRIVPRCAGPVNQGREEEEEARLRTAEHLEMLMKATNDDSAPMLCECCDGKGELECSWCHGTGVMTLGDTLYCSDGGCSLCIICKGQGACTCKRCRGTGRRAAWLPPLPGCPVE
ncbi:hypothetical protein ACKKBG_A12150 [Auxenochlorella protothecoides x Auxenochlorella symbiontica]